MKKKILIVSGVIAVIALCVFYFSERGGGSGVVISTTLPKTGTIAQSVTATGTLQPVDTVSVGAQVSGVVRNLYVDFNDVVKKGQLLAKIDPSLFLDQVQAANANLSSAQSNLQYQQSTFDRQSQLFNLGTISKADYQVASNQKNSAAAAVDNARAQLAIANRNLFYTNIYSPIDGMILNRNVSAGQTIASSLNAPTLFVIANDLTKMQVRAAVDEADIGNVKSGQRVSFTVDAFPEDVFNGFVQEILLHAKTSANVVTYTTLIDVANKQMKLKPGMTANIEIVTEEDREVMVIPVSALSFRPDAAILKDFVIRPMGQETPSSGKGERKKSQLDQNDAAAQQTQALVWVKKGDTLAQKKIAVGIGDDKNVRVITGLSATDEVVTSASKPEKGKAGAQGDQSPFLPKMQQKKR